MYQVLLNKNHICKS